MLPQLQKNEMFKETKDFYHYDTIVVVELDSETVQNSIFLKLIFCILYQNILCFGLYLHQDHGSGSVSGCWATSSSSSSW